MEWEMRTVYDLWLPIIQSLRKKDEVQKFEEPIGLMVSTKGLVNLATYLHSYIVTICCMNY